MRTGSIRLIQGHAGTDLYLRAGSGQGGCDLARIAVRECRGDGVGRPAWQAVEVTWLGLFGAVGLEESASVAEITARLAAMHIDPLPLLHEAVAQGWPVRELVRQRQSSATFGVETDETGWITVEAWTAEDAKSLAAAAGLTVLHVEKADREGSLHWQLPVRLRCKCGWQGTSDEAGYDAYDNEYRCPRCGSGADHLKEHHPSP